MLSAWAGASGSSAPGKWKGKLEKLAVSELEGENHNMVIALEPLRHIKSVFQSNIWGLKEQVIGREQDWEAPA